MNAKGEFTDVGRIHLKLYKFHPANDWAVFIRVDGGLFSESDVAHIDTSLRDDPHEINPFAEATVLHCPVALVNGISKVREYSVGCNLSFVHTYSKSIISSCDV